MDIFNYVKSRLSILDVAQEYLSLKKAGSYWKGLSPFQYEKTPSFTVSPHKEIYYCFSSNTGGDLIHFISKMEECSQREAVNILIERYNITLPEELQTTSTTSHAEHKAYDIICNIVATWCHDHIFSSYQAHQYLSNRGLGDDIITSFRLGYFPGGSASIQKLLAFGRKHKVTAEDFIEHHMLMEGKSGLYSPFEERIIFPICDHLGTPRGFGGRVYKEHDKRPKYYNSHDNAFFNKGRLLYGLDKAKKAMQQEKSAFLVEGYTDCLALHQAQMPNAIATLGTACTKEHLTQIARYTQKLYVLYDGDAAGKKAMLRLTHLCWDVNVELYVISLPDNHDPSSYLHASHTLTSLTKQAKNIFYFYLEHLGHEFIKKTFQERLELTHEFLKTIHAVADPLKRDLILHHAAQTFDMPFDTLKSKMRSLNFKKQQAPVHKENTSALSQVSDLEKRLFSAIINNEEGLTDDDAAYVLAALPDPLQSIAQKAYNFQHDAVLFDFNTFYNMLDDHEKEVCSRTVIEMQQQDNVSLYEFLDTFYKRQWKYIVNHVKMNMQNTTNNEQKKALLADFEAIKHIMKRRGLI
jgi:DNA primase